MTIKVANLTTVIEGRPVITDVSFTWPAGTILGLTGRNGAGKTTLFRTLTQQFKPARGTVSTAAGDRIFYLDTQHRFLEQVKLTQIPELFTNLFKKFDVQKFADLLAREQINLQVRYGALSRGQRALVRLCIALSSGANHIILDEPFAGLDVQVVRSTVELIVDAAARGIGFLIATHEFGDAEALFDEVLIMADGHISARIEPETVLANARLIHVVFADGEVPAKFPAASAQLVQRADRELSYLFLNYTAAVQQQVAACQPLSLTEDTVTLREIIAETERSGEVCW